MPLHGPQLGTEPGLDEVDPGRVGTPEDIAEVVAFFASDKASYVNGQTVYVDGGISKALMSMLPRPYDVPGPHAK